MINLAGLKFLVVLWNYLKSSTVYILKTIRYNQF